MTTTQYAAGDIIITADEAYRILQINDKGHARTISDSGSMVIHDLNSHNPETTKVIPDATAETWAHYITKAHTARHINNELTRSEYRTEFLNPLVTYRHTVKPEVVPTISLLDEANTRAAVQNYLETITASVAEGQHQLETLHNKFMASATAILESEQAPEFSIPDPNAGSAVIKGFKFNVGWSYRFEVDIKVEDEAYGWQWEQVYRYATVTRVTKSRAYLAFEDGVEGYVVTAGSKSYHDLMVYIGEESYPVSGLREYSSGSEEIAAVVEYCELRSENAKKLRDIYREAVRESIEVNPFWDKLFLASAYREASVESAVSEAVKTLRYSVEKVAKVDALVTPLLGSLSMFEA